MKKQVVVLSRVEAGSPIELIEILNDAGISVRIEGSYAVQGERDLTCDSKDQHDPLAILYEFDPQASIDELRSVLEFSGGKWPDIPVVACRRSSYETGLQDSRGPQNTVLNRIGFRAVADRSAQLPALLRQVEEGPGTGELKLPPEFKSPLASHAFSLPASVRVDKLRGALALLASLHLGSNQKPVVQAPLAGIARLVAASRWTIFVCAQTDASDSLDFEPLVAPSVSEHECLSFDAAWRRELLHESEDLNEPESNSARAAAMRIETIKRMEDSRRVIALPLVSGERVIGVLEGVRNGKGSRKFSA